MSWLLDALGYVGDTLDKPGRAVRGLLAGRPEEALAALPFSDSLGLTDEKNRVSGSALLDALGVGGGELGGFAAEIATDPLTFAGVGLGRRLGGKAGEAAVARGPRFGTTGDDLSRMVKEFDPPRGSAGGTADAAADRVGFLGAEPEAKRILSEIDPRSKILGAGAEGIAFADPGGNVVRVGYVPAGTPGRPIAEGLLPATATTDVPLSGKRVARVERSPLAGGVGVAGNRVPNPPLDDLSRTLERGGLDFVDGHAGNVGMYRGKPTVIDPGAVEEVGFAGPRSVAAVAAEPGRLMTALLDSIGADDAVRAAYASGLSGPTFTRKFGTFGGLAGANAGVLGRHFGE